MPRPPPGRNASETLQHYPVWLASLTFRSCVLALAGLAGGKLRFLLCLLFLALLLEAAHAETRDFKENIDRDAEEELTADVGRRQHGSGGRNADNRILPRLHQRIRAEDANAAEQCQQHRELETRAKSQQHHLDEADIFRK